MKRTGKLLPPREEDRRFITTLADHLVGQDLPPIPTPEEPMNEEELLFVPPPRRNSLPPVEAARRRR